VKLIIAGSRGIINPELHVATGFIYYNLRREDITEIVSGTCWGIDEAGEALAEKLSIPVKRFPADWKKYKAAAGMKRNKQMADYADALLAIWDGDSKGTLNMIARAQTGNLQLFVWRVGE